MPFSRVRSGSHGRRALDGRSARNRLTARKLGMVVARLDETIRRSD